MQTIFINIILTFELLGIETGMLNLDITGM